MKAVARIDYNRGRSRDRTGRANYFSLAVDGAGVGWGIRMPDEYRWGARASIANRWVHLDFARSAVDDTFAHHDDAARWILEQIPGCADLEIEWVK